jgi:N-acetylmuramoyl-L-alanine amidase
MDNKEDLAYLTSAEGRKAIIATHVEGVINYIKKHGKG